MLGREVEDDAMVSLAQKRFAGCLGSKHAGLAFDAEVAVHPGDFADRDIESGDQGLRAVAAILELAPLDLAGLHWQSRRGALQGLNAGHLVDRGGAMALIGAG